MPDHDRLAPQGCPILPAPSMAYSHALPHALTRVLSTVLGCKPLACTSTPLLFIRSDRVGTDVQVYLVATTDATDNETVTKAGFRHLGALKGNVGDQNYEVPADLDLSKYQAVTIWCRRFGVNFGTAPLTRQPS